MDLPQHVDYTSRETLARHAEDLGLRLDSTQLDNLHAAILLHQAEVYGSDRLGPEALEDLERFDSNESSILGPTGTLEYVRARENATKRPAFKGRMLVPVTHEVPRGATTASYNTWDETGMAELIANPADDVRMVGVKAEKHTFDIEPFGLGYSLGVQELESAAYARTNLRSRKARANRHGFERRLERIAAIGHPGTSIKGLLNHPNVPVINAAAAAAGGNSPLWMGPDKTAQEVLDDLLTCEDTIVTTTEGVEAPTTLVLDLPHYRFITKTQLEVGTGADPKDTIAKVFLERATSVREIDWWTYCATADTAGTGPRAVMYARNPDVVHHEIPAEPTELPPQKKSFALNILAWMKSAGVWWEYPLAGLYLEGY